MSDTLYVSLRDNAEALWPRQFIAQPPLDVLENIWFEPMRIVIEPTRKLRTAVLLTRDVELGLPGLEQISIVLGAAGENTTFILEIELEPVMLGRLTVPLALRLRNTLLKPVRRVDDGNTGREDFQIDDQAEYLDLSIAGAVVTLDQNGDISITSGLGITLPLCSVGDTGLIIEGGDVSFDLRPEAPAITLGEVRVLLPDYLPLPPTSRITMRNARIDSSGFSGEVSLDLSLSYDENTREFVYLTDDPANPSPRATIYGDLSGGLRHVRITVEQNRLTTFDVSGSLIIPYFDQPADIRINFASSGAFTVTLLGGDADGITLTKEELLALNIRALTILKKEDNVSELLISGGLEPLLMSGDGLQWPRLDVTDLSIDSNGKFSIREAWLDLKELATLDLWGFHFELRRIGIGSEARDDGERLWVDLSGGLRLIEQIPVALDVEGFRLTWPRDFTNLQDVVSKIEVEFAGIHLFFGVPDAVEFEGLIRFFKNAQTVGFAGDVALRVPASGFAAEAGLLVGLSFDPPFPFLYVYFGVELPAGIPLGQSGLALKGALGMFGLNVSPNKTEDQNWYHDWYKGGVAPGAHQTEKWKPEQNALALGVGVTITTTDGYVKGTRGLIVLSVPGPILMIEGRALILGGLQPNAEPPLRALAVFDGGAGTVQFNVEAEATLIADLLRAYGMLEAFFDFNDLTNWHLYLGQDTPRNRRIRADLLKLEGSFLFEADAYLMMDMVGAHTLRSRIGASIGFEPDVDDIGPLGVDFVATLEGDGLVTARPEQFSGQVELSAEIRLSAFGQSFKVSAEARFLTEGPKPLKVGGMVEVAAELPAPLDPVETSLEFDLESIEFPRVESPLSGIAISSRFEPSGGGFSADAEEENHKIRLLDRDELDGVPWERRAKASPVVPVDSQPIIGFKQKMNSPITSFARHPDGGGHHYNVGPFDYSPSLVTVELYEHLKTEDDWTIPWKLIASTAAHRHKPLPGVWLVESEPESPEAPSPRRVQLWTDNPLSSTARAMSRGLTRARGSTQTDSSLAARILNDHPDLMRCIYTKVESVCVDFEAAGDVVIEPGDTWGYKGLLLGSTSRTAAVRVRRSGPSGRLARALARLLGFVVTVLRWVATWRLFRPGGLFRRAVEALRKFVERLVGRLSPLETLEACLHVDGDLDIHFSWRVQEVRIVLCRGKKIPEEETRWAITARRRSRTAAELRASGENADPRDCNVGVAADLRLTDLEWRLEADAGFDCVRIVNMGEFAIREICYTTLEEVERGRLAAEQCDNNSSPTEPGSDPSGPGQTLRPGAYYRLDVITTVTGELNLPSTGNSFIDDMLDAAYKGFPGSGTEEFFQTCFFQTEGPPVNLRPYIKWVSPQHQSERFFYGDKIAIRFLRSDLHRMFGPPFNLKVQIRDAQGQLVGGVRPPEWTKSRSATRFPEEGVWEAHRATLEWPHREAPKDDVLLASLAPLPGEQKLLPRSRYQLELVRDEQSDETAAYWYFVAAYGGDDLRATNAFAAKGTATVVYYMVRAALGGFRGELHGFNFPTLAAAEQHRDANRPDAERLSVPDPLSAVLFSSTFVTSGFESFQALVASFPSRARLIVLEGHFHAPESIREVQESAGVMAQARRAWERAEVDYRFETLQDGRKGLEAARLLKREAEATHDANFRALAEQLTDLYFRPVSGGLELYLLRDPVRQAVIGAWLRAPESLDMRLSAPAVADDPQDNRVEHVGRTEVRLSRRNHPDKVYPIVTLHNADSTQLLIFPELRGNTLVPQLHELDESWWDGRYAFVFTYHRDYGDELGASDHRYDRPVEHSGEDAEARLEWSWE